MNNLTISQNFLFDEGLVLKLIKSAGISKDDVIYDIGAGQGIISKLFLSQGYKVKAFEADKNLVNSLYEKFATNPNINIFNKDFLEEKLREGRFSVFSNIPFNQTTKIVTKLLVEDHRANKVFLVMQEEAAYRILGVKEGLLLSLLISSFYETKIIYKFKKNDFKPSPKVNVVLVEFVKRDKPIISLQDRQQFLDFICFLIMQQKPSIEDRLKNMLTYNQIKIALPQLKIDYSATLYQIDKLKYFEMFYYFQKNLKERLEVTQGWYKRYKEINSKNKKVFKTRF